MIHPGRISVGDAAALLANHEGVLLLDMRDEKSYRHHHHPAAMHLNDSNLRRILKNTEKTRYILISCYHGISSQDVASTFAESGFTRCFSVDGGYDAWRSEGLMPMVSSGQP